MRQLMNVGKVLAAACILFLGGIATAELPEQVTSNTVTAPNGTTFAPMRVKAAQDRTAAAVRAEQRRFEAAKAAKARKAAAPAAKPAAATSGAGVKGAAAALLQLSLAQVGTADGLVPTAHAELAVDVGEVGLDRRAADDRVVSCARGPGRPVRRHIRVGGLLQYRLQVAQ